MSLGDGSPVDATTGAGTFDARAARALTESMTVIDADADADLRDDEYRVHRPESTYTVDMRAESCDCPDALHGHRCKHQRRVDYATGTVPIPGWVNREAIDPGLGAALGSDPRIAVADGGTEVFNE
jgi:hypothetical protein